MKYSIYYDDKKRFDSCNSKSDDKSDNKLPSRGVQAIVQDHPDVGVEIVTASDYYVWFDGRWKGVDIFGLFDFLLDFGMVLFGRTISRDEYQEIIKQAMVDKAGWLPGEIKING